MSSRRKQKQQKKQKLQEEAQQKQLRRSKLKKRILATVFSLALVVGGALAYKSCSCNSSFRSKKPAAESIQKKKVLLHFSAHTIKGTFCGLKKAIEKNKPSLIFLEGTYVTHEQAKQLNGSTKDYAPVAKEHISRAVLRLIKSYNSSRKNKVLVYPLESYVPGKKEKFRRTFNEYEQMPIPASAALDRRDIEGAVNIVIQKTKALATDMKFRNDVMFKTVKKRLESSSSAMIIVGGGHDALGRLFKEAGYIVEYTRRLDGVMPLANHYESLLRGWGVSKVDEKNLASQVLTSRILAHHFQVNGLGRIDSSGILIMDLLKDFSYKDLVALRETSHSMGAVIPALAHVGYQVPSNNQEYLVALRKLHSSFGQEACP
jgi:hypothetical protein